MVYKRSTETPASHTSNNARTYNYIIYFYRISSFFYYRAILQMEKAEKDINKICLYLKELRRTTVRFHGLISTVSAVYMRYVSNLIDTVEVQKKQIGVLFRKKKSLLQKIQLCL